MPFEDISGIANSYMLLICLHPLTTYLNQRVTSSSINKTFIVSNNLPLSFLSLLVKALNDLDVLNELKLQFEYIYFF